MAFCGGMTSCAWRATPSRGTHGLIEFGERFGVSPRFTTLEGVQQQRIAGPQLELKIRATGTTFDIGPWLRKIGEIEARVCRIEYPELADQATGFLVGPDLVLTNYHVVEPIIDHPAIAGTVALRFDYKVADDGVTVQKGVVYKLAQQHWLAHFSEYADTDGQLPPATNAPADKLDFAFLRVNGKPGDDPVGGPTKDPSPTPRGWIKPPVRARLRPEPEPRDRPAPRRQADADRARHAGRAGRQRQPHARALRHHDRAGLIGLALLWARLGVGRAAPHGRSEVQAERPQARFQSGHPRRGDPRAPRQLRRFRAARVMIQVGPAKRLKIQAALLATYKRDGIIALLNSIDRHFEYYEGVGSGYPADLLRAIDAAAAGGWLPELVRAAAAQAPADDDLGRLVEEFEPLAPPAGFEHYDVCRLSGNLLMLNRSRLRKSVKTFMKPTSNRILVVQGNAQTGKTHTA